MSDLCRPVSTLVIAALLLVATPAFAENSPKSALSATTTPLPTPIVAVVDVQRIMDESLAARSVQKQLETQRSKFQTEIEKEENELRKAEQDLTKSHDQLTADTYSDHEQQLRQRFLAVERHVQERRKVLDQTFNDSMNEVRASLLEIVNAVAHEHGSNLVLIKQQVLWTDKALDVTDEVLGRLNTKMPQVPVKTVPEDKAEEPQKPAK
jgi:outer membrane protein